MATPARPREVRPDGRVRAAAPDSTPPDGAAVSGPDVDSSSRAARRRSVRDAVEEVSAYLGNTPAVCRASYIDPRVFDRFDAGITVAAALERLPAAEVADPVGRATIERAVLDLISDEEPPPD